MQENIIFVYGSLRTGLKNHHMLNNSQYMGEFTSEENFHLVAYKNLQFPYLVNLPIDKFKTKIKGEIYKVNSYTLTTLDLLESHPDIYQRQLKIFTDGKETIEAWVYILVKVSIINYILDNLNMHYYLIESGDWIKFLYNPTIK